MKVVRTLDEHQWREFALCHPQAQIYHTPEMFQVFERAKGYKPSLWAVVDVDGRPLVILPTTEITLKSGPLHRFTTRAVAYGSLLCELSQEGEEALGLLLAAYNEEVKGRILFTELRNLSSLDAFQPILNRFGFSYEEHLNYLIDLARPKEMIWESIRSSARRNVRRARRSEVVVTEVDHVDDVDTAYALLKETYKRLQVPLADRSLFLSAFETLFPQGMFKIFLSKAGDVDIGVMTLLLYKNIGYYWYAGIKREFSSYRAGDLLAWHALEWGSRNNLSLFDFGGAGKPHEEYGVRDFKAKYGGQLVNYGRNISIHSPWSLKIGQFGYTLLRRFL